jgi:predicted RNase H-like HicB family nuclease
MNTPQYLVRIGNHPASDWGVPVPDLPGCVATGKTIDQALRRIERAVAIHIPGMREDGVNAPSAEGSRGHAHTHAGPLTERPAIAR